MPLPTHTRLRRYEILSQLGAGGMGEAYLARDPKINREVAIKVLPLACSIDEERLRRFEQEAQAAGALNHPNILAIYDVAAHDGYPYVVSELLEGKTLHELMAAPRSRHGRRSTTACRSRTGTKRVGRWCRRTVPGEAGELVPWIGDS